MSVMHRTEGCSGRLGATSEGRLETCRIAARVDGAQPVEQEALCRSMCFVSAFSIANGVASAMLAGNRAKIRVSGPSGRDRRDFELSLWGFSRAKDWVESKCASASGD